MDHTCRGPRRRRAPALVIALVLSLVLPALPCLAQNLPEFEKSVTEFTLDNGMKFIVVERRRVPIVAFHLYVDVGAAQENIGQTGVSHLFEHMAFKGTRTIGTVDYKLETEALQAVDAAYEALEAERAKGDQADPARVKQLQAAFEEAQQRAGKYVKTDEFSQIIDRAGGVGLNASTAADATKYYFALPSNKLELWFSLESGRFLEPVLREYYKERDVVLEERRMRTESQPFGRLLEEFLAAAYKAHPYGQPVVGHFSEISRLKRQEAGEYFRRNYVASALTAVVVGDVDAAEVKRLAQTYFGRLPKRPPPDPLRTVEPPQFGERRVIVEAQSQPYVLLGYHRPGASHPDSAVLDVISDILGGGRTSWLYEELVKKRKIAVAAEAITGYPGEKYPGLFIFFGVPAAGQTAEEVEKAMEGVIERIRAETAKPEELEEVKRRARAAVLRSMRSYSGLAEVLAENEVLLGDWRELFRQLDTLEKVTPDDVQRAARQYFRRSNRTVGWLVPEQQPAAKAATSE